MENTVRLNDQEIIDIAWEAVRGVFKGRVIETSDIEVRHSLKPLADITDPDDDKTTTVWFVHQNNLEEFDPRDITRANLLLWESMKERGDQRFISLYHGYRSDPRATRKAA
jgi:hypothetical protein